MSIKRIIQFFTKNWGVKVFCACVAAILWIYVVMSQSTVAKFPGSINIKVFNTPAALVAVYDVKKIDIKVMAEAGVWQKLSAESFSASIDLSGLSEGTHEVPVNVTTSIAGAQIVEKTPDRILVTLEPLVSKDVSIAKRIEGNAADGMVPGSINFTPDKVRIKGAKSLIENIDEVAAVINLSGESESFTRSITLAAFNDQNEAIKEIEISPTEVEANVSIVRGSNTKTVGIKVKVAGSPKENYFISNIATKPGVIDITGVRDTVLSTSYIETASIDVSNLSSDTERDVSIVLPDGVMLLGSGSSTVHVTISISPVLISKTFSITDFKIINSALQLSQVVPSSVRVTLQATPDTLSKLSASDFSINLDMKGKNPNSNNEVSVAISAENINTPTGVTVVSIDPQTVVAKVK